MKTFINNTTIILLPLLGLLIPTSSNGIISEQFEILIPFIVIFLLAILFFINKVYLQNMVLSFFMLVLLLFFTFIQLHINNHIFTRISWGGFLSYIAIFLIYSISYEKIGSENIVYKLFVLTNIFVLIMGFLIILDLPIVEAFFIKNYSVGYPELVHNMLAVNKPVTFFGSHSIAAFFYYLFFAINFITYRYKAKKIFLFIGALNLIEMSFLNSVSALLLLCISIAQILIYIFKYNKRLALFSIPVIASFVLFLFFTYKDVVINILLRQNNGFLGRFGENGVLGTNLSYISTHILSIGLWYSDELYFTDSGIIINLMKGSILLVFLMYGGLYLLFKNNINNITVVRMLTFMFVIFEIAYPILNYSRMTFLLPFFVIYLNKLTNDNNKIINLK